MSALLRDGLISEIGSVKDWVMQRAIKISPRQSLMILVAGVEVHLLPEGALWWPEEEMLVVSDLHFEKGSSYAARGQMLPPYDTGATLGVVEALFTLYRPKTCISLGDSFHDGRAEARLTEQDIERIKQLTECTDWIWVEGNHDPDPPDSLGGYAAKVIRRGGLVFRHEPTGESGEISGHLHPVAKVVAKGRSVRRKCFVCDESRLVMPAMGSFAGGLNVKHEAFSALFPAGLNAHALGGGQLYTLLARRLVSDTSRLGRGR